MDECLLDGEHLGELDASNVPKIFREFCSRLTRKYRLTELTSTIFEHTWKPILPISLDPLKQSLGFH